MQRRWVSKLCDLQLYQSVPSTCLDLLLRARRFRQILNRLNLTATLGLSSSKIEPQPYTATGGRRLSSLEHALYPDQALVFKQFAYIALLLHWQRQLCRPLRFRFLA